MTDLGLPEPAGRGQDPMRRAVTKAAVVAGFTGLPAIAQQRCFRIDPLLRWHGGGPQWRWPLPWPHSADGLSRELKQANDHLNACGYFGPGERGAYLQCVLGVAWPGGETRVFEGRIEGWFISLYAPRRVEAVTGIEEYFRPDGYRCTLAELNAGEQKPLSEEERAYDAFARWMLE